MPLKKARSEMPNSLKSDSLEIALFPCLMDNYGLLIHDRESGQTAAIDTPDGNEIRRQAEARGWQLTHIWNTHHHPDHTGGNMLLKEALGVEIIGPGHDADRIAGLDRGVRDGESFQFGAHDVQVFETPGHTNGHIIFYVPDAQAAFVGDTIFALGCGRLFEGTPAQMYESLKTISALPDETQLYCAHEYTLSNARFAITVEPENTDLQAYIKQAEALRAEDKPTVPTSVGMEKKTNPFVRAATPERLGEIRAAKDRF